MNTNYTDVDASALTARWWMLVIRGVAAILFGILAIALPQASLMALVLLWGAYAIVDGTFTVMLAAGRGRAGGNWGWLLFEGLVGIGAGIMTFVWPGITALLLLVVIAAWAVLTGIAELAAAIRLRREIRGEWLLALSGALSIAFGILLLARPGAGALTVMWLIGAYAIGFGVVLVGLGLRLHRWGRTHQPPTTVGGASPTPA